MPAYLNIVSKFDEKALKKAQGSLGDFGKKVGQIAAAATAAVAGIAVVSVKEFAKFDSALNQSLAIMGEVSDELQTEMANAARSVAKTTTFSAEQAAEAYFFLASAGLDAASSIEAMPQVAKFAQAGMFDMALATDLLTDAQSALGMVIKNDANANLMEMTRLSDVLVRANTLANASVEQFSTALTTKAGASLRQFGKDAEEGVAVLAALADQGIKGELAGTNLSIAMRDLTSKALANKEEFKEHNIAVFDSAGEMRNMADIVADLENATDGMSDAQKKATFTTLGFSDKSMGTLAALMGTSEAIKTYEKELRSASGFTDDVAGKQLETMTAQFQLLKSRVLDVGISIGQALAPTLLSLADKLMPLVDDAGPAFIALFVALTPAIEAILELVPLLLTGLIPVIESLGLFIRDVLNPAFLGLFNFISNNIATVATFAGVFGVLAGAVFLYSNRLSLATKAQALFAAVMLTNPLYLVAAAVAAVAAGIVYLATQTTFFQDTWKTVTKFVGDAWTNLYDNFLKPVFDAIADSFTFVYEKVIAPIIDAILIYIALWAALFEWLYKTAIEPILREIGIGFEKLRDNVIEPVTGFIEDAFHAVGEAMKWVYGNLIQPALDSVGDAFKWVEENIITPVSTTISDTVETLGETFETVFQGVSDFMGEIFNGLVEIVRTPLNSIIDLINDTIAGLNTIQITIPDWAPKFGGQTFGINIPKIPRLADGGIVMPRPGGVLANIAEAGQAEAVIPLDRLGSMGNTYNINISAGIGSDPVSIGRYVVDAIKRYESVSGKVFAGA
jgi:TP901 family phage tail tape measure protein